MALLDNLKKIFHTHGYLILIIGLFLIGTFLRLYNFENRLIFGPEQGMSFITSAQNLEKFSLLGETNLIRTTSAGHIPFHGAVYSYLILPLLLLFNYHIIPITLCFVFLNLFTAFIFFWITKSLFGKIIASLSLFFFLTSDIMIHHSLFAWIVNPTPLLGVLTLWYLSRFIKNKNNPIPIFLIGIFSGLGFGFQSFYLLFAIFLLLFILFVSKKKLFVVTIFLLGVIVGSLPTVLFDIRHDFYHIRTFFQFFIDVFSGQASGSFSYYNFLFFYPYLFLFYAFVSKIFYKLSKPLVLIPITLFLFVSMTSPLFNLNKSSGMAPGMTLKILESTALAIFNDNPPAKFNVATLWDFDSRAHTIRYILTYYYHQKLQSVEEYKNLDALYVFATEGYNVKTPEVFELQSYMPYKIKELSIQAPGYKLYKFIK